MYLPTFYKLFNEVNVFRLKRYAGYGPVLLTWCNKYIEIRNRIKDIYKHNKIKFIILIIKQLSGLCILLSTI